MLKKSMRTIPAAAQDELRERVVNAINAGMPQAQAARVFGVADRSIRRWVAQMRVQGTKSITPKRRGRASGTAGKLSTRQCERIRKLVVGKMPDQLKLPFYLWTRQAVGELVRREYGVKLSPSSIGNYLKRWGLTPQRPVRQAYERDDARIADWLHTRYPEIAKQAKKNKAIIYWGGECGVRSGDVRGRSFAPWARRPRYAPPASDSAAT
jgi:transposase